LRHIHDLREPNSNVLRICAFSNVKPLINISKGVSHLLNRESKSAALLFGILDPKKSKQCTGGPTLEGRKKVGIKLAKLPRLSVRNNVSHLENVCPNVLRDGLFERKPAVGLTEEFLKLRCTCQIEDLNNRHIPPLETTHCAWSQAWTRNTYLPKLVIQMRQLYARTQDSASTHPICSCVENGTRVFVGGEFALLPVLLEMELPKLLSPISQSPSDPRQRSRGRS